MKVFRFFVLAFTGLATIIFTVPLIAGYIGVVSMLIPVWITVPLLLSPFIVYQVNTRKEYIEPVYLNLTYLVAWIFLPWLVAWVTGFERPILDANDCDNFVRTPRDFLLVPVMALPAMLLVVAFVRERFPHVIGCSQKRSSIYLYLLSSVLSILIGVLMMAVMGVVAHGCLP